MRRRVFMTGLVSLAVVLGEAQLALAKPPGLPAEVEVFCDDGCEPPLACGRQGGREACWPACATAAAGCDPYGCGETRTLADFWRTLSKWFAGKPQPCKWRLDGEEACEPPQRAAGVPAPAPRRPLGLIPCLPGTPCAPAAIDPVTGAALTPKPDGVEAQAGQLYQLAEQCLGLGDVDIAVALYQRAIGRCPHGQAAQQAIQKLGVIGAAAPGAGAQFESVRPASHREERPLTRAEQYVRQLAQAQEMFHIAEKCRREGDLEMAYACYHEAQRLCPGSGYARRAEKYIDMIEQVQQGQEEAEPVARPPQQSRLGVPYFSPLVVPFHMTPKSVADGRDGKGGVVISVVPAPVVSGVMARALHLRTLSGEEECEVSAEEAPEPTGTQWLRETLKVLGGPSVELDVDTSRPGNLRVLGGVHARGVGCQVIYDNGDYRVSWPTLPSVAPEKQEETPTGTGFLLPFIY